MFDRVEFDRQNLTRAAEMSRDDGLRKRALDLVIESDKYGYGYQWTWLGLPIIQLPQDIVATQEIIWKSKPDVIIETGIAWGGSVALYASLLQLIGKGKVVAVDLNLMDHVSDQIMSYPFSDRIHLYKGSSTDPQIVSKVQTHIEPGQSVMVLLDSNHTHQHVLEELRIYAPLVTKGQYVVVSDTVVEDIPAQTHRTRPWGPGDNPKTALHAYLKESKRFEIDQEINRKLLLTYTPDGYARCVE
ncbi:MULTISPECIES: cephalosporin hydroxylase family protein [unclassified Bradyrhizobium]|uniref:cephalosporin hydroxylase family protein n=1 Tax=unclassified Bradyrhizobium TaxID=2631580 RepID=UPI002FF1C88D